MKLVINTALWTDEYLEAIKTLLNMAGFRVDETYELMCDEEGDIAVYPGDNSNASIQTWILETLRNADVI